MSTSDHSDTSIEARIATGFARISTAMRSKAWAQAAASGLTPTQADILHLLASRGTALRLSAIVEQLAITPATASDAVNALVGKKLVEKSRAPDDGRAIALTLTDAGARAATAVADWTGFLATAAETLDEDEQAAMLKLLIKMIRALQQRGDIPVNRMCVSCRYFSPHAHPEPRAPHHCHLVDAAFGDRQLRLDCPEHEKEDEALAQRKWAVFSRT